MLNLYSKMREIFAKENANKNNEKTTKNFYKK